MFTLLIFSVSVYISAHCLRSHFGTLIALVTLYFVLYVSFYILLLRLHLYCFGIWVYGKSPQFLHCARDKLFESLTKGPFPQ